MATKFQGLQPQVINATILNMIITFEIETPEDIHTHLYTALTNLEGTIKMTTEEQEKERRKAIQVAKENKGKVKERINETSRKE